MKNQKKPNNSIEFGKRIRAFRESINLSQEQVHYATSISQPYLVKIENGTTNIGLGYISLLADFFGVKDFELLQYDYPIPTMDVLKKSILSFLKRHDIDPSIFFKKGLVFYLESSITGTKFFNTPRLTKEIVDYLNATHDLQFSSSAVSQALNGFIKKGLIEKVSAPNQFKYLYRKKSVVFP